MCVVSFVFYFIPCPWKHIIWHQNHEDSPIIDRNTVVSMIGGHFGGHLGFLKTWHVLFVFYCTPCPWKHIIWHQNQDESPIINRNTFMSMISGHFGGHLGFSQDLTTSDMSTHFVLILRPYVNRNWREILRLWHAHRHPLSCWIAGARFAFTWYNFNNLHQLVPYAMDSLTEDESTWNSGITLLRHSIAHI